MGIMGFPDIMGFKPPDPSGRDSGGKDSARATKRKTQSAIKDAVMGMEGTIEGPVTRLFGNQTGKTGFTLKNIKTAEGSAGDTAKVLAFEGDDGVTYYINGSTSYS
jgi:hypothetical protein